MSLLNIIFISLTTFSLNPAFADSFETAKKALAAMGADVEGSTRKCSECHSLSASFVRNWGVETTNTSKCLEAWSQLGSGEKTKEQANQALSCIGYGASPKLGLFAARMTDVRWPEIFSTAFEDGGDRKFKLFRSEVGMPRNGEPGFSDEEWLSISEWVNAGQPYLNILLSDEGVPGLECDPFVSDDLKNYLLERQTHSWKTKNAQAGMINWSCEDNNDTGSCFRHRRNGDSTFPRQSGMSAGDWTIRKVTQLAHYTSYWMRVSPDGRFVASGLGEGVYRDDRSYSAAAFDLSGLLKPAHEVRTVLVDASYDPSFFPDESGFIFQSPNMICPVSLLKRLDVETVDSSSPGCSSGSMSLYHSSGSSLEGGRYVAFSGQFLADEGSGNSREDYPWSESSNFQLQPFLFDGQVFSAQKTIDISASRMGDAIVSPSSGLLVSRTVGQDQNQKAQQTGYRVDMVQWTGDTSVSLKPVGAFCSKGAKGTFSYDERFFAYHQYNKAGFSNIYVTDLLTNHTYQITNLSGDRHAVYPSFRSDGWLYFMIKGSHKPEVFVTNAVLEIAKSNPLYLGVSR